MALAAHLVAGFAGCALTACTLAGSGVPGAGTAAAPAHVVTAAPGTHTLPLPDQTRRCLLAKLENGELRVVRLTLAGLRPRNAGTLKGVRIFVERPALEGAAAEGRAHARHRTQTGTSPVDPHAAGAIALGLEAEQTYVLNIAPTLDALWRSGALDAQTLSTHGGLRLTFIADPWDEAQALPRDFALSIRHIGLDVPCD